MVTKNLFTLTLLKAVDILDCFEDDRTEIGIKGIAEQIGMPQSSVYRIIQSLEFTGLIFQNKENKKYCLGPKMVQMSKKVDCLEEYIAIAVKYMEELNSKCDETINLAIADCDSIINVHKVDSSQLLRPNFVSWLKYPICTTGLGKVLLAEKSTATLKWIYELHQDEIGKTFEEFKDEIKTVKKQGFALDDEEFNEGLRCAAAPIYGHGGNIMFSMSISAPTIRMDDEHYKEAVKLVMEYSALISKDIQEAKN